MEPSEKNYKRIVIKIGSSLFYPDYRNLDLRLIKDIAHQVYSLVKSQKEIVLVSSGAIALGMHLLGMDERPKQLNYLQSVSAIGQNELMDTYRRFFGERVRSAQVLLTWEDFSDRKRYLNAQNTLLTLFKLGSIPIINENDTISTDEIKFGDNDRLSALVSSLISADLLIILSDVDGLLDKDKKTLIRVVDKIDSRIKDLASPTRKETCAGGMVTKIEAAKISVDSGIPCVIANGRKKNIVLSVIKEPQKHGTLFLPKEALRARERWLAFSTKPKGKITVDEGARGALINKKSLLSVGVVSCEGNFEAGDIVSVIDRQGYEFARGKICLSNKELEKVRGRRYDKEIIHRDNIVIL